MIEFNFSVDRIVSQLGQHDTYLKDISSMPRPLERPQYDNKRNYTYDTSNILILENNLINFRQQLVLT